MTQINVEQGLIVIGSIFPGIKGYILMPSEVFQTILCLILSPYHTSRKNDITCYKEYHWLNVQKPMLCFPYGLFGRAYLLSVFC